MTSPDNSDLYEVTCENCHKSKSYYTAQGVNFFKLNHEGHQIKVMGPSEGGEPKEIMEPKEAARTHERVETQLVDPIEAGPVRLGNLVVDVVDEEKKRAIMVYGIAGGHERFSKEFDMNQLGELNGLLESGLFIDDATSTRYIWSPDKIDLSNDVARMLDEAPAAVVGERAEAPSVRVQEPQGDVEEGPVYPSHSSDEILTGKTSYIQQGKEYVRESMRISNALRKFRWNIEPPYVIGAMFDNLMSVQSQIGMMKGSVIDAVAKLGYTFVAIEAPNGCVTAWFRRNGTVPRASDDEILEFRRTSGVGRTNDDPSTNLRSEPGSPS